MDNALGTSLLIRARNAIASEFGRAALPEPDHPSLHEPGATFVTLTQQGQLRGCIGSLEARRPLAETDWQMIEMAGARDCPVHVLLSKSDKLTRNEARETLRRARAELGESATCQLFSAVSKDGIDEARGVLKAMLARQSIGPAAPEALVQPWERRS